MKPHFRAAAAAIGILACAVTPASSDEGMWTYDNFPQERMREALGWAPDQAWLDRVMAGAARLPGCSGSNVSAEGLMLTNHHCITSCLRNLSSTDNNYLRDGFTARAREDEVQCPNYAISVLTGISDVTERTAPMSAGTSGSIALRPLARGRGPWRRDRRCSRRRYSRPTLPAGRWRVS
jgi:hypothetical protein